VTHRRDPLPTDVAQLPRLPADYDAAIEAGLRRLGLDIDGAARTAIASHVRLLLAWTVAINLTSIREPAAVAREHVLDSLAGLPLIRGRKADEILDLGSGGGFPGLPLAIALPASRALLVESVGKKVTFLASVADAVGLRPRVAIAVTRAERLAFDPHHRGRWPIVTVRAVGSLPDLVELALPLMTVGGALIAWKRAGRAMVPPIEGDRGTISGRPYSTFEDEFLAGSRAAAALGGARPVVHPVQVEGLEDHVLVVVEKVSATPPGWPRDPAARRRKPW
jgi:16S rRNA (guanine527-N7)-methyltransferase